MMFLFAAILVMQRIVYQSVVGRILHWFTIITTCYCLYYGCQLYSCRK